MKLHLFDHQYDGSHHLPEKYENFIYGIVLIAGIPVVVIGLNYLIDVIYRMVR